jgi:hypothetical protein
VISEVVEFFLCLLVLREIDDKARNLFFVQRGAKQNRERCCRPASEIFFERRARAKRHQLLERFFVETMMLRRREIVNAARQFRKCNRAVQETVVGVENVSCRSVNKTATRFVATRRRRAASTLLSKRAYRR